MRHHQMMIWIISVFLCYIFFCSNNVRIINNKVSRVFNVYLKRSNDSTEITVLNSLHEHHVCHCNPPRRHFPRVLFQLDVYPLGTVYALNNTGTSLDHANDISPPPDLETQCECIFDTMRRANVQHQDMLSKNVCIDKHGTLTLIDFELVRHRNPSFPYLNRPDGAAQRPTNPIPRAVDHTPEYLVSLCKLHLSSS